MKRITETATQTNEKKRQLKSRLTHITNGNHKLNLNWVISVLYGVCTFSISFPLNLLQSNWINHIFTFRFSSARFDMMVIVGVVVVVVGGGDDGGGCGVGDVEH